MLAHLEKDGRSCFVQLFLFLHFPLKWHWRFHTLFEQRRKSSSFQVNSFASLSVFYWTESVYSVPEVCFVDASQVRVKFCIWAPVMCCECERHMGFSDFWSVWEASIKGINMMHSCHSLDKRQDSCNERYQERYHSFGVDGFGSDQIRKKFN